MEGYPPRLLNMTGEDVEIFDQDGHLLCKIPHCGELKVDHGVSRRARQSKCWRYGGKVSIPIVYELNAPDVDTKSSVYNKFDELGSDDGVILKVNVADIMVTKIPELDLPRLFSVLEAPCWGGVDGEVTSRVIGLNEHSSG